MPDFNNKKEMLRRLRAKRERNRALWLPCVTAEFFVKAWYAVICRAGLALSDKNGKFLGVADVRDKPKAKRQDDIVYVRKPFFGRLMSAVLAACFVMMFMPEVEFNASAVDIGDAMTFTDENGQEYKVRWYDVANRLVYKIDEEEEAKNYTIQNLVVESAYDAMHATWDFDETKLGENDGYHVIISNANSKKAIEEDDLSRYQKQWQSSATLNPKLGYSFLTKTYSNIDLYVYNEVVTEETDEQGNKIVKKSISLDPQNRKARIEGKEQMMTVPALGKSLTIPKPAKMDDLEGGKTTATIKWSPSDTVGITGDDTVDGYRVYKCDVRADRYTVLADIPGTTKPGDDGMLSTTDTVTPGGHYRYIIEAYKILWDDNNNYKYDEKNPGMITSSEALKTGSLKEKFGSYMTKNDNYAELYVAPNMPDLTLTPKPANHQIDVGWGDKRGSTSDGVFLFRSDHQIRDDEWNKTYDTLTKYLLNIMDTTGERDGVKFLIDPASNVKLYEDTDIVSGQDYWYYIIGYINKSDGTRLHSTPNYKSTNMDLNLEMPQNLDFVSTDGKVDLTWDKVENADGYILTITKLTDNKGNPVKETPIEIDWKSTKYTHKSFKGANLLNGEQYRYTVKAYANVKTPTGDQLTSKDSYPVTATVGIALGTPQDLKLTTTDGTINVSWAALKGAEGYILHYKYQKKNGTSSDYTEKTVFDVAGTKYTHSGLNNGDRYTYYVVGYKTVNGVRVESSPSDEAWIIVGVPLDSPKDFKGTTSDGRIDLTWTAVKGAEGYILHITGSNGTYEEIDLSKPGYQHIGLKNGEKYTYYVTAYKTVNGERVYSDDSVTSANRVTLTVGDTLESPKDFTAITTDGQTSLNWTKVDGAQGYVLYAYGGGRSYQFDLSRPSYLHTGLKNGDNWTYYVVAYKTVNGQRVYSDPTRSVTVTIGVSLNAVVDLVATAGNRQVDLTWTDVKGAEGYAVYLLNTSTNEFEPITLVSKPGYSHVGLKNGRKYTYMVAAYKNVNGERKYGEYSMSVDAIPTTGSNTDIDHSLNVKGTTPYGISHSEYISAAANHGAFDESVDVYFSTNKEATESVKDVLKEYANGLKSFIIYPFDISVYEEDTLVDIAPYDGYNVTVTMPIPDRLIACREYITVVHVGDKTDFDEGDAELGTNDNLTDDWIRTASGRLEVLPCAVVEIDNVWCVQFVCTSFSPYAFVIYKDHITDVSAGGGIIDGSLADTFNSGVLLFTALPDILPNNKRLKVVSTGKKRYHIKRIEKR